MTGEAMPMVLSSFLIEKVYILVPVELGLFFFFFFLGVFKSFMYLLLLSKAYVFQKLVLPLMACQCLRFTLLLRRDSVHQ